MTQPATTKEAIEKRLAARAKAESLLDSQLSKLISKHGLQGVLESLRRVCEARVEAFSAMAPFKARRHFAHKWGMALNIIQIADRALYGQHCGDVR